MNMIEVDHVSMRFNMAKEKHESLKEYFLAAVQGKLQFEEFYALRDVSFNVEKGDFYGLIGLNGSGKSTLLKIISGVYKPTTGKTTVHGTIAPLIELGAGFDMDLTARENIYLNGTVLGMTPKFIESKFDEIVEFSELRDFLDVAAEKLFLRHGQPHRVRHRHRHKAGRAHCGRDPLRGRFFVPGEVRAAHEGADERRHDGDPRQPLHQADRAHVQPRDVAGKGARAHDGDVKTVCDAYKALTRTMKSTRKRA